jgi:hypothetical protein
LALYSALYTTPFSVSSIVTLNDQDMIVARKLYATLTVNVYSPAKTTLNPTASGSLGTDILSNLATDPELAEALSLIGHEAPTWGQIYDIIEFLGGEKSGFGSRDKTGRIKRIANHHRHLGSPRKYTLPPNPPTLNEASQFARGLLKTWISRRI